jgi:hypothetical protein
MPILIHTSYKRCCQCLRIRQLLNPSTPTMYRLILFIPSKHSPSPASVPRSDPQPFVLRPPIISHILPTYPNISQQLPTSPNILQRIVSSILWTAGETKVSTMYMYMSLSYRSCYRSFRDSSSYSSSATCGSFGEHRKEEKGYKLGYMTLPISIELLTT